MLLRRLHPQHPGSLSTCARLRCCCVPSARPRAIRLPSVRAAAEVDPAPASVAPPALDDALTRTLWDSVSAHLLRLGRSRVTPTHIRSLTELVAAHSLVKVQLNGEWSDGDIASTSEELGSGSGTRVLQVKGKTILFAAANASLPELKAVAAAMNTKKAEQRESRQEARERQREATAAARAKRARNTSSGERAAGGGTHGTATAAYPEKARSVVHSTRASAATGQPAAYTLPDSGALTDRGDPRTRLAGFKRGEAARKASSSPVAIIDGIAGGAQGPLTRSALRQEWQQISEELVAEEGGPPTSRLTGGDGGSGAGRPQPRQPWRQGLGEDGPRAGRGRGGFRGGGGGGGRQARGGRGRRSG